MYPGWVYMGGYWGRGTTQRFNGIARAQPMPYPGVTVSPRHSRPLLGPPHTSAPAPIDHRPQIHRPQIHRPQIHRPQLYLSYISVIPQLYVSLASIYVSLASIYVSLASILDFSLRLTVNRLSTKVFCSWTFVHGSTGPWGNGYTFREVPECPYFMIYI